MAPRRLGLAALLSLTACGGPRPEDPAIARRAIAASTARYAAASRGGDAHALAQLYDEHAVLMPPDREPVEGRDSIEAYWTRGLEEGFELRTTQVEISGRVAYSIGRWSLPATDDESADSGKLVLCWKRVGNTWRVTADIWNSSVSSDSSDEPEPRGAPIPIT